MKKIMMLISIFAVMVTFSKVMVNTAHGQLMVAPKSSKDKNKPRKMYQKKKTPKPVYNGLITPRGDKSSSQRKGGSNRYGGNQKQGTADNRTKGSNSFLVQPKDKADAYDYRRPTPKKKEKSMKIETNRKSSIKPLSKKEADKQRVIAKKVALYAQGKTKEEINQAQLNHRRNRQQQEFEKRFNEQ